LTPVVDLLWGHSHIPPENLVGAAQIIIDNLNKRLSVDVGAPREHRLCSLGLVADVLQSVDILQYDSTTQIQAKQGLHEALKRARCNILLTHASYQSSLKAVMERLLEHWVTAHPTAFPELHAEALFFVNIMPVGVETQKSLCMQDTDCFIAEPSSVRVIA
jgi:hypothetical protein